MGHGIVNQRPVDGKGLLAISTTVIALRLDIAVQAKATLVGASTQPGDTRGAHARAINEHLSLEQVFIDDAVENGAQQCGTGKRQHAGGEQMDALYSPARREVKNERRSRAANQDARKRP